MILSELNSSATVPLQDLIAMCLAKGSWWKIHKSELPFGQLLVLLVESVVRVDMRIYQPYTGNHLYYLFFVRFYGHCKCITTHDFFFQTPLHLAVIKGSPKCIKILLEYGAKMDIKNSRLETPFDLVEGKKSCEKEFQKNRIPSRNEEQQQRVESN